MFPFSLLYTSELVEVFFAFFRFVERLVSICLKSDVFHPLSYFFLPHFVYFFDPRLYSRIYCFSLELRIRLFRTRRNIFSCLYLNRWDNFSFFLFNKKKSSGRAKVFDGLNIFLKNWSSMFVFDSISGTKWRINSRIDRDTRFIEQNLSVALTHGILEASNWSMSSVLGWIEPYFCGAN